MAPSSWFKRGESTATSPPPPPEAIDAFKDFVDAQSFQQSMQAFDTLLQALKLSPGRYHDFYPKFRLALKDHVPFRYKEIFKILDAKAKQKPYGGVPAEAQRVLVVGAGPCGLRAAIETQLLGAKTVILERREEFTRHNILKLWKFIIPDLKSLAVKKFCGKFCSGQINHIGIQTLQLFLAKVALILGIQIQVPCSLESLIEPHDDLGWTARVTPAGTPVDNYEFDMIVVASGKKVAVEGFNRRSLDAKLSIAVTVNFVNHGTTEEKAVRQISGVSKQYHQDFFRGLKEAHDIDLENLVYYCGKTHYFVMTALRKSLIERGVILSDKEDRKHLLAPDNIDRAKLHQYAIDAAQYSTGHFSAKLPATDFAQNAHGDPSCSIFDFTNLYSARNASRVMVRKGCQLLMAIVGDSLLEPFWPEGTGCGRGFLSSMDAAWLLRQWSMARANPLEILTERENIYKLLSQTSDGPGNLRDNYKAFTVNPATRYKNIPSKIEHDKILELYDTDASEEFSYLRDKFVHKQFYEAKAHRTLLQRLRKGVGRKKSQVVNAFRKQRQSTAQEPNQAQLQP